MNKILLLIFAAVLSAVPVAADEPAEPTEDYLKASRFISEYKDAEPFEPEPAPVSVPHSSKNESNPAASPRPTADSWGMIVSNSGDPRGVSGMSVSSQALSKKRKAAAAHDLDRPKNRNVISSMISPAINLAHPAPARGGKVPAASRNRNAISSMIAANKTDKSSSSLS